MAFSRKKLPHLSAHRSTVFKYLTMFFLGASCVLLMTQAFEIDSSLDNAIQYINQIFLTVDGSNITDTGISLDGTNGDAYFSGTVSIGTTTSLAKVTISGNINSRGFIEKGEGVVANGQYSTAMGYHTQASGDSSTAMGDSTESNGDYSTAMGYYTTAIGNMSTAIGGSTIASGDYSIAMGNSTIANGDWSTAMGYGSHANEIGSTAIGRGTTASGAFSTAMGAGSYAIGTNSTAMGELTHAIGTNSTAMGYLTTSYGDYSTAMGYYTQAIGDTSTAIGKWNVGITGAIFEIGIGTSGTDLNNAITVLSSNGYVGIGTTTPATALDISGDVTVDDTHFVTAGAYYYNSDKRLKTDITSITDPLEKILSLNGYMFTWKNNGKKDMGVIAQEVEKTFPEIIHTNNEGYKSVEYGNLVAPLIEAIKELNAKVDAQAQEIKKLESEIRN